MQEKLAARPAVERPRYLVPSAKRWRDLDTSGIAIVIREDQDIVVEGKSIPDDKIEPFMTQLLDRERGAIDVQAEPGVPIAQLEKLASAVGKRELRLIVGRDGAVADRYANVKPPKGAGAWFAPLIEQLRAEQDPAKTRALLQDAVKKARAVVDRTRTAISAKDLTNLSDATEALNRTLNMFRGVVSKTRG